MGAPPEPAACADWEAALADAALAATVNPQLDAHLLGCARCRAALTCHRSVWEAVASLRPLTPGAGVREAVLGAAARPDSAGTQGVQEPLGQLFDLRVLPPLEVGGDVRRRVLAAAAAPSFLPGHGGVAASKTASRLTESARDPWPRRRRRRWVLLALVGLSLAVAALVPVLADWEVPPSSSGAGRESDGPAGPTSRPQRGGAPAGQLGWPGSLPGVGGRRQLLVIADGRTPEELAVARDLREATALPVVEVREDSSRGDFVAAASASAVVVAIGSEAYGLALTLPPGLPLVYALVPRSQQRPRDGGVARELVRSCDGKSLGADLAAAAEEAALPGPRAELPPDALARVERWEVAEREALQRPRPSDPRDVVPAKELLFCRQLEGARDPRLRRVILGYLGSVKSLASRACALASTLDPDPAVSAAAAEVLAQKDQFRLEFIPDRVAPLTADELLLAKALFARHVPRLGTGAPTPGAPPADYLLQVRFGQKDQRLWIELLVMRQKKLLASYNVMASGASTPTLLKAMVPRVIEDLARDQGLTIDGPRADAFPWGRLQRLSGRSSVVTWEVKRGDGEVEIQANAPQGASVHRARHSGDPLETMRVTAGRMSRVLWTDEGVEFTWDVNQPGSVRKIRENGLWDADTLLARLAGVDWLGTPRLYLRAFDASDPSGAVVPLEARYAGERPCGQAHCRAVQVLALGSRSAFDVPLEVLFGDGVEAPLRQVSRGTEVYQAP